LHREKKGGKSEHKKKNRLTTTRREKLRKKKKRTRFGQGGLGSGVKKDKGRTEKNPQLRKMG